MTDEVQELSKMFFEYANQLEKKILLIKQLFTELDKEFDANKLTDFYRAIHNLKGSAGLYGYQKIHQLATQLDAKIKNISQSAQFASEADELSRAINQLHQAWCQTSNDEQLKKFLTSMGVVDKKK